VAQEQQGSSSADLIIGPGYNQRFARAGAIGGSRTSSAMARQAASGLGKASSLNGSESRNGRTG